MKKIYSILTLAVMLVLFLCLPVSATENSVDVPYVFDDIDCFSYEEWSELENRAKTISQIHQCGIYFAIVDDYTEYGDGSVYDVTTEIYHDMQFGLGEGHDGIIVLLSMAERDYAMFVYGENAEYAFNEYGQKSLEETILEDFGNGDWYSGVDHYLDACDEYLTRAEAGKPVTRVYWKSIAVVSGITCLCVGIICFILMSNMKTVHKKVEANEYITAGGMCLTEQYDRYTHTTETRTKIEKSGSGSDTSSESGGGGSGRSGKF